METIHLTFSPSDDFILARSFARMKARQIQYDYQTIIMKIWQKKGREIESETVAHSVSNPKILSAHQ